MLNRALLPPALCLLAGLAGGAAARAQEPPAEPQQLAPMKVEVVRLEVVVTDKRRRPLPDLKREAFQVFEDGKPQPIVQFQAFTRPVKASPGAPAAAAAAEEEAEAGTEDQVLPARYIVLVIDDVHMSFQSLARLRKAMDRFILENLRPEDQVALVTTSGEGAVSQEFTPDRAVLRQTLSRLTVQERRAHWQGVPHLSEYQAELIERNDPLALDAAIQEIMTEGQFQDAESAERLARQQARMISTEAAYNSRLTLETLDSLTRGLASLSGRKVIFLVSDGFLTGMSSTGSGLPFDVRRITDAATRAGVVTYALDTRGLVASPPIASAWSPVRAQGGSVGLVEMMQRRGVEANRDAMNALAADTGGFLVDNDNDLQAGLKEILDDTEAYYVLAYEPTSTGADGSFRKIEVKLPGVSGIKIRTRSGYFAPNVRIARSTATPESEARRDQQRRAEMRTALFSLAPLAAIPVSVAADFVSIDSGITELVVSGRVDLGTLPFEDVRDRHRTTIEVVAVVCDETGAVVKTLATERTQLDLSDDDHERLLRTGFPYQKSVAVPAGRYLVRLAARDDATGLLGSARQSIEVPDLAPGRLAISSVFLLRDDAAGAAKPGEPALISAQALRYYEQEDSLYAQLYAYNPKRDGTGHADLVSQAEILKGGELLGKAAPEVMTADQAGNAPVSHTTRIRLQRLEPGDYELRMTVTDRIANAMVSRRVGFRID